MASSLLSYVPLVNCLVGTAGTAREIKLEPVEVHNVETAAEKRPRTLKHLLRANHVNHSIVYHNLQFDNHMAHILCSAYLLGADVAQLHNIYDVEAKELEPWQDSPAEITKGDWRDFLGDKHYQRAYIDFFEDNLAFDHAYDWKKVVAEYMFEGKEPLVNGLIGGRLTVGHPLIHLGYAFEMDSREIAIEALGLAAVQHNYLHRYGDDPSYTKPAPFTSASPAELVDRLAADERFDGLFDEPGFGNIDPIFEKHEALVLEYWNAWDLGDDPVVRFRESQELAVDLLTATVAPGTHAYNFFVVHLLTSSHAVRILLPHVPVRFHVGLVRQWWLLALAVYVALLRPKVDRDRVPVATKSWAYVEEQALKSKFSTDAHFVKAVRAMKEASRTWGDAHNRYLNAAVRFVDDYEGWKF
ncbi:hypothetical protein RB597_005026 [Gaeumannomyces tritici]